MLATNPRISQLAGLVKHYAPLKPKYALEMVTLLRTTEQFTDLPQWLQDHLLKVESIIDSVQKHLAGKHDQSTHAGNRATVETPEFTADELLSIQSYTGTATIQVNHKLRGLSRSRGVQPASGVWVVSDEKIDTIVKDLDSAIAKSSLKERITLERDMPEDMFRGGILGLRNAVGKTISDKGFLSMKKGQSNIPPMRGKVKFRITAPAGTKALDMSFINEFGMGEIILPRDTKIKITSITGFSTDTLVRGEIVG